MNTDPNFYQSAEWLKACADMGLDPDPARHPDWKRNPRPVELSIEIQQKLYRTLFLLEPK